MIDNKNIINFSGKKSTKNKTEKKDGYECVVMENDLNGKPFIKSNLLEYADKCTYVVRIMKELNGKYLLYNYLVPQNELSDFLVKMNKHTLVEIEKYILEDFA